MGIFDRKQKSQEMKLISAIVATAAASPMTKTGQWNGVDESNTCGMTFEWQDANGDPLSIVNATCSWQADSTITFAYGDNGAFVAGSNAVTGFESGSDGSASVRFFFAQTCVNGTCDNSTCWEFTSPPNCEANPNNEGLAGMYIQENINDHRGSQDNWNLQIQGATGGQTFTVEFGNGNQVTNLTSDFATVSGSGNSWAVTVQDEPFGDLLQMKVEADAVPDLWSTVVV